MSQVVRYDEVPWVVPAGVEPNGAGEALEKRALAQGEAGFFNQVVRCPPGWVIPVHSHDHDELFVVLRGSCEVAGERLQPFDTASLPAGTEYGIDAGPDGLDFMVVRTAAVETVVRR